MIRRIGLVVLVLVVLVLHLLVADRVRDELDAVGRSDPSPKRMSVAYVRELMPTVPVLQYAAPVVQPPSPAAVLPWRASRDAASAQARAASEAEASKANAKAEADAAKAAAAAASAASAASAESRSEPTADSAPESLQADATAGQSSRAADAADMELGTAPSTAAVAASASAAAAASASTSASATPPAAARPFEWPASTRLSYVLTGNYRGEVHGTAQVEWIRDESRYQVHLDVVVGAEFAPLFTRRMSSDGRITAQGLAPLRYDEDSKLAFQARRVNAVLFGDEFVTLSNGTRVKRPAEGQVQDSASQFVQLTWLFSTRPELLAVGRTVEVPLALPRSMDTWVYDVLEHETLATPFGGLEALHLKPRRLTPSDSGRSTAASAEVWFAPSLAYLPVRILIHQNADTYLDLMISRLPQMAAAPQVPDSPPTPPR